jgi:hypothetical protein
MATSSGYAILPFWHTTAAATTAPPTTTTISAFCHNRFLQDIPYHYDNLLEKLTCRHYITTMTLYF